MPVEIRQVAEWSVVRLDDGRVGVKGHSSRKAVIHLDAENHLAVEVGSNVLVEVLAYPAQTAFAWFAAHQQQADKAKATERLHS